MFEGLISTILNKVLGDFIDNIDSNQLDISITSGEVVLKNMKVKSTIFDSLPVPFSLVYGQIGLIFIKVPIWNLVGAPLVIEIKDVLICARPKHIKEWNEDVEIKSFKDSNQSQIDEYEALTQNAESLAQKDPSSVEKLAAKILDNIIINVENVYFRYEDQYSAPHHGSGMFSLGVLLKEFSIGNFGADWKAKQVDLNEEITHKLAKLQSLSLFLDFDVDENPDHDKRLKRAETVSEDMPQEAHTNCIDCESLTKDKNNQLFLEIIRNEFAKRSQKHTFIIDNFSMEARIKLNQKPITNLLPQVEVELLLGSQFSEDQDTGVNLIIHQPQIIRILKLIEYIGYYNEFQQGALSKFQRKSIQKEMADEYIKLYIDWKMIGKKNEKESKVKRKVLKVIEEDYPAEKIIMLRRFANKIIEQQIEQQREEQEIDKKLSELKSKQNWGMFVSRAQKVFQQKELDDLKTKLQNQLQDKANNKKADLDNELNQLTHDLEKQQIMNQEQLNKMPEGYIRFKFDLQIPSLKFSFVNEFDQLILNAYIIDQFTSLHIGKTTLYLNYQIFSVQIEDCWSGAKAFPYFICTQEMTSNGQVVDEQLTPTERKHSLIFKLEKNDKFEISPLKISIVTEKTLFIVANIHFLKEIQRSMICALEGEVLDFSYFQEQATEKALKFMSQGKEFIELIQKGEYKHEALDIQLYLTSPIILVPQNVFQPELHCLYIDTGSIELVNNLAKFDKSIDYKKVMDPTQLYDRYEATLSNFQIGILPHGLIDGVKSFSKSQGMEIVKEFTAKLTIFNCVEPMHPEFHTAELSIIIENFSLSLGQKFIGTLLRIQKNVEDQLNDIHDVIFRPPDFERFQAQSRSTYKNAMIKRIREEKLKLKMEQEDPFGSSDSTNDDEIYNVLLENFDPQSYHNERQSSRHQSLANDQAQNSQSLQSLASDKEEKQMGTNFKMYFGVKKMELTVMKEMLNKDTRLVEGYEENIHILIMHLGTEIEIDRYQDININASIFKILIEDVQTEYQVAQQFRMILSSPMIEQQMIDNYGYLEQNNNENFMPDSFDFNYDEGVMRRSLLQKAGSQKQENDEKQGKVIEFLNKDGQRPKLINQLEIAIFKQGEDITITAAMSDIRFVTTIPTAQKLLKILVSLGVKADDLLQQQDIASQHKLQLYEKVLRNLASPLGQIPLEDLDPNSEIPSDLQDPQSILLLHKILVNSARCNFLSVEEAQTLAEPTIEKLRKLWGKKVVAYPSTKKAKKEEMKQQQAEEERQQRLNQQMAGSKYSGRRINEKKNIVDSKIKLNARMNRLALWIPMYADNESSQIMVFEFQTDISYSKNETRKDTIDISMNQVIATELVDSTERAEVTLSEFMMQTMTLNETGFDPRSSSLESQDALSTSVPQIRQSMFQDGIDQQAYQSSKILKPSRIGISLNKTCKGIEQQNTIINIDIAPMHFIVGFRQIDFAHIVFFQALAMLDHVQQFEKEKRESKLFQVAQQKIKEVQDQFDKSKKATGNKNSNQQIRGIEQLLDEEKKGVDEEMQDEEKKLEKAQAQRFKFEKWSRYRKSPISCVSVKLDCEAVTISINDDQVQKETDLPFVHIAIRETQVALKSCQTEDDAASFMLKKLGIWQKRNPTLAKDQIFLQVSTMSKFHMNYYNQRVLAYEPLIEPWFVQASLMQQTPYTQKNIKIESAKQLLNINLTFGMAMTLTRLIDRVQESVKQAKILTKINKGDVTTHEEQARAKAWKQRMLSQKKVNKREKQLDLIKGDSRDPLAQAGFLFQNLTGMDLKIGLHDELADEELQPKKIDQQESEFIINQEPMIFVKDEPNLTFFKSLAELQDLQTEILMRSDQAQQQLLQNYALEEDPLKIDIKIKGLKKFIDIPIEALGVYSYSTEFADLTPEQEEQMKKKNKKPFPRIRKLLGNDPRKMKVGIVVKISMENHIKRVTIESQLLLANNLPRHINLQIRQTASSNHNSDQGLNESQSNPYEIVTIEPNSTLKVPLSWIYPDFQQNCLLIETERGFQMLFACLDELFADRISVSNLQQTHSQIVALERGFYATVDIIPYKCMPKTQQDGPPQYVVYFNYPLSISNLNFHSLEISNAHHPKQLYAVMGPKETAKLNQIDFLNQKPNIEWSFYETEREIYTATTLNYDFLSKANQKVGEKFNNGGGGQLQYKALKMTLDMRKTYYQNNSDYNENFMLREKIKDREYTTSMQVLLYPEYMIVNKTSFTFVSDRQSFAPYSNSYFNPVEDIRVSFRVPGYKNSQPLDIRTRGLSGAIVLDLDQKNDVNRDELPQNFYIPDKLEFGIIIASGTVPFNNTVMITLVPRYVLVNQTGIPIVVKQKHQVNQIVIKSKMQAYNFEMNKNKFMLVRQPNRDELFALSQGKEVFKNMTSIELFNWSSPFQLEDVDDFQVCFRQEANKDIPENERKWYEPSETNHFMRHLRVIVTTQNDASILVVFSNPQYPEYEIFNKSDSRIEIAQLQDEQTLSMAQKGVMSQFQMVVGGEFSQIRSFSSVPFTWTDRQNPKRKLALKLGDAIREIDIEKAMKRTEIWSSEKVMFYIEVKVSGNNKKVILMNAQQQQSSFVKAQFLQSLLRRYYEQIINFELQLKGLTISFIDDAPKELLLFTLFGIEIQLQQWVEPKEDNYGHFDTINKLQLHLKHVQLDNMVNQIMPVIFAPTKPLKRRRQDREDVLLEEIKEEVKAGDAQDDDTPFFQVIISTAQSQNVQGAEVRLRSLQFAVQEFVFQLETTIISNNFKLLFSIVQLFTDLGKHHIYQANEEFFEKAKFLRRDQICEDLDALKAIAMEEDLHANKTYIELIHLGAIKAYITFKFEKSAVELDVTDAKRGFGILNLIFNIMAGVASVSNSPLSFKELVMVDVFTSKEVLVFQLSKNYSRQALRQFYKLLGSSDLIGNPVGLVNKLGTGVYEFISEPAKGLLKGPDEFGKGLNKGVQSLVSNVVSGGFDSVSKITGSLYSVLKSVQGESNQQIQRSENVRQGLFHGVKGGVSELVGGVTGIITKPIKKTKQEGAKGFIKGLGSGFIGAITAPMAATLRAGSSVAQGISNAANNSTTLGRAQNFDTTSQYSRFRPPRYINTKNVLTIFNEEMAVISRILSQIYSGRFATQTIKLYTMLPETEESGRMMQRDPTSSMIVITDRMFFYIKIEREGNKKGRPTALFKSRLWRVRNCQIFEAQNTTNKYQAAQYLMVLQSQRIITHGTKEYVFQSNDYQALEKIYNYLSVLPQIDTQNMVKAEVKNIRESFFDFN